jgi:hypothetical protein
MSESCGWTGRKKTDQLTRQEHSVSKKGSDIDDPFRSMAFSQERWRERFLTSILRGACVLGLAAAVVAVIDSTSHGQVVLGGIYSADWVILAVITIFRWPYSLRAGVFLFLLFALGMSGLFEAGMRGDARLLLLVFSIMATLPHGWANHRRHRLSAQALSDVGPGRHHSAVPGSVTSRSCVLLAQGLASEESRAADLVSLHNIRIHRISCDFPMHSGI